jgi:hypothetical protein
MVPFNPDVSITMADQSDVVSETTKSATLATSTSDAEISTTSIHGSPAGRTPRNYRDTGYGVGAPTKGTPRSHSAGQSGQLSSYRPFPNPTPKHNLAHGGAPQPQTGNTLAATVKSTTSSLTPSDIASIVAAVQVAQQLSPTAMVAQPVVSA